MDDSYDNKLLKAKLKPIFDKVADQVQYSDGASVGRATRDLYQDYEARFQDMLRRNQPPETEIEYLNYGFTLSIEMIIHYLDCPDCKKKIDLVIQDIREKQRRLK